MPRTQEENVKIGARFSTRKIIEQAALSERLARAAAAELGAKFPAARIEQIKTLRGEISTALGDHSVAASDKVVLTGGQDTAFEDGKTWVRNLIDAATSAFDGDEKRLDGYTTNAKIGRSVPRLLERVKNLSERAKRSPRNRLIVREP